MLKSTGICLCLAGLLLMISGDSPLRMIGVSRWQTSVPFFAWSRLYLLLLLSGIVCFAAGGGAKSRNRCIGPLVKPVGLLLGAFFLSTLTSGIPALSLRSYVAVLSIVMACWIFALLMEDERFRRALGPVAAIALLLLAASVILWRYDEGLNTEAYHLGDNAWLGKLQLAWVFNLFGPLLLAWSVGVPARGLAAFYAGTWVLTGAAIYVLGARMGLIVFGLTTLGVWILTLRQWRRTLPILIGAAVIGVTVMVRTEEMARYVVSTIVEPARNPGVEMRLGFWKDAIRLFTTRPITGHGLGTYDVVAYTLEDATAQPAFRGAGWHAHNTYLHVLAETGLLGLLTWCYLWFAIAVQLLRAWRGADPPYRPALAGALSAIFAFLVLSISEVMIASRVHASFRMSLTLAFIVALGLSVCSRATGRRTAAALD